MKRVMMGTEAAALAAVLARVQVIAAYPITPQTVTVEELSDYIGSGRLNAEFLTVESEHSALAACVGASATGARVFTATSSQGLALMHEMLHYASSGRLPIVMLNANRALATPWNLYCDHTDSLSQRDTGWLQYYCTDVQDVMDSILIAYKVAESAMLPVMINLDGFYLTHTSEIVDIPDQETVDRFLPTFKPECKVDVEAPSTFGAVCGADLYMSLKYRRQKDTLEAEEVWSKMAEDFALHFERRHPVLDPYRMDDAEVAVVALGTAGGTVRLATDALRDEGVAAGALRLSMFRPFPKQALVSALGDVRHVVVIDRDVSIGAEGIMAQEIKACLFGWRNINVHGFIAGIGGVDITVDMLQGIVKHVLSGQGMAICLNDSYWVEVLT